MSVEWPFAKMKNNMQWVLHVLLLIFSLKTSLQECGEALEKAIMCVVDPSIELINTFDYNLCTHIEIDNVAITCEDDECKLYNFYQTLNNLLDQLRPKFPQEIGIYFGFDEDRKNYLLGNEERVNKTVDGLVDYLGWKDLGFVTTSGISSYLQTKKDEEDYIYFLKTLSDKLHDRGYYLGQSLDIASGNTLATNFNITQVAELVDWFSIRPQDLGYNGHMQPFTPLKTHRNRYVGTTEFWIDKVSALVKPECLLVDLGPRVERHKAEESKIQPGPGSLSSIIDSGELDISKVCQELRSGGSDCHRYFDDESSTPWAVCGTEYYTYEDAKSLRLKAEYLKKRNVSGVILWTHDVTPGNICGEGDPMYFFKAVQEIRH